MLRWYNCVSSVGLFYGHPHSCSGTKNWARVRLSSIIIMNEVYLKIILGCSLIASKSMSQYPTVSTHFSKKPEISQGKDLVELNCSRLICYGFQEMYPQKPFKHYVALSYQHNQLLGTGQRFKSKYVINWESRTIKFWAIPTEAPSQPNKPFDNIASQPRPLVLVVYLKWVGHVSILEE